MEIHRLPGKGHYNTSLLVINCIDKNTTNNERDMKNVITNKAIVFFELQYKGYFKFSLISANLSHVMNIITKKYINHTAVSPKRIATLKPSHE